MSLGESRIGLFGRNSFEFNLFGQRAYDTTPQAAKRDQKNEKSNCEL
jgi:hypothetical protein